VEYRAPEVECIDQEQCETKPLIKVLAVLAMYMTVPVEVGSFCWLAGVTNASENSELFILQTYRYVYKGRPNADIVVYPGTKKKGGRETEIKQMVRTICFILNGPCPLAQMTTAQSLRPSLTPCFLHFNQRRREGATTGRTMVEGSKCHILTREFLL
jgi:hypothetical protein